MITANQRLNPTLSLFMKIDRIVANIGAVKNKTIVVAIGKTVNVKKPRCVEKAINKPRKI